MIRSSWCYVCTLASSRTSSASGSRRTSSAKDSFAVGVVLYALLLNALPKTSRGFDYAACHCKTQT